MRSRMIAFCLALMGAVWLPPLPPIPVHVWVWIALPALAGLRSRLLPVALIAACGLGVGWGLATVQHRVAALLPAALEGQDLWVWGTVQGLPRRTGRAQQMVLAVQNSCTRILPQECVETDKGFAPRHILLNYYGEADLTPGQRWRWRVRLTRPRGFSNPGGFDYEAWLMMQGISARGYVRDTSFNESLGPPRLSLDTLRYSLRQALDPLLAPLHSGPILLALILGERDQISAAQWSLFSATGTTHLIVISGLHVGLMAGVAYWVVALLVRLWPPLLLHMPAQKCGALAAILAALGYSLLAGFSLPTQRALIMVVAFMGCRLADVRVPVSLTYLLAMSVVLAISPLSVLGAGFWLSFGAVGSLLLALAGQQVLRSALPPQYGGRVWRRVVRWLRPQGVVFVGMMLPLVLWTPQVSLLSPVVNLIAIPLVSALVVPPSLLAALLVTVFPAAAEVLLQGADAVMAGLMRGLTLLVHHAGDGALWQPGGYSALAVVLAGVGSLLLLLPRGWPGRARALVCFFPLLFPKPAHRVDGQVSLTILDAGQGLSIVVQTASHTLVYDTGPAFSENFDAGTGMVLPFLRQQGIQQPDLILVSHGDRDHSGGLASLRAVMTNVPLRVQMQPPLPEGAMPCTRGQHWEWEAVRFEVLWPPAQAPYRGNDSSCVLRIRAGGHSMLLTGDIERPAEEALLALEGDALRSTLLVVPHHGSATSSSPAFLAAVQPQSAVFSAGYRSQFGHPAPEVAARYERLEIAVWNTALSGALQVTLGEGVTFSGELLAHREQSRRFWDLPATASSRRLHGVCAQRC